MPYHPPIPDPKPRGKSSGIVGAVIQAEKMMQIALILPCAALVGWLLGGWLGVRFHLPWLGLVGIVFGGVSGLIYVVRLAVTAANAPQPGDEDKGKGSTEQ